MGGLRNRNARRRNSRQPATDKDTAED
jgi:hypothetical protein